MTLEAGAGTGAAGGAGTGAGAGPATDYAALCQQARAQLAAGDGAGAVASARRAAELLPRGLEGQRLLGLSLLAAGETRPGLGAFQTALAGDPLDVVAQAGVATAQEQIGGSASAEAEWLRTWELSPGLAPVEARLQQAREAAGAPAMPAGREPYPFTTAALARVYLRGGLYEHAVAEARAALTRQPERADLHLTLAEALWRAGDGAGAGAQAEHLLERLPDCAAANLLLAAQWQAVGRDPAPLLSRVRAVDPAGEVAARLFGDREAPPPLDGVEGAHRPGQAGPAVSMPPAAPAAPTAPAAPAAVAPAASPLMERPPEAPAAPETAPEVAPAPAAATERASEPEAAPEPALEPEAEPQPVAVTPPAPDRPPISVAPPAPLPTLAAGAAGAAGVAGAVVTGAVAAAAGATGGADDRPAESQSVLSGRVNAQAGDPVAEAEPDPPSAPPQHLSQVADLASSPPTPAPSPAPTPVGPAASAPGLTPAAPEPVPEMPARAPASSVPAAGPPAPAPAAPEPEPEPEPEPMPETPEPAPAAPASPAAPAAPAAQPAAYLQSLTLVQGAADLAVAGDEAMQRGDYITAIQSYGAALRRLRSDSP